MTIEEVKEIFKNKTVEIKLGKFLFDKVKLKFYKNRVNGYQNGNLVFRVRNEIFLECVENVDVKPSKG